MLNVTLRTSEGRAYLLDTHRVCGRPQRRKTAHGPRWETHAALMARASFLTAAWRVGGKVEAEVTRGSHWLRVVLRGAGAMTAASRCPTSETASPRRQAAYVRLNRLPPHALGRARCFVILVPEVEGADALATLLAPHPAEGVISCGDPGLSAPAPEEPKCGPVVTLLCRHPSSDDMFAVAFRQLANDIGIGYISAVLRDTLGIPFARSLARVAGGRPFRVRLVLRRIRFNSLTLVGSAALALPLARDALALPFARAAFALPFARMAGGRAVKV